MRVIEAKAFRRLEKAINANDSYAAAVLMATAMGLKDDAATIKRDLFCK